jgi:hypothetical protein
MVMMASSRVASCLLVLVALTLCATSCHRSKGLAGEDGPGVWTLEMNPHPDTVAVGVNDTIFVAVRQGGEARGGIAVTFVPTLGDPVPTVVTIIDDPNVPWGTWPMATFISREDTGVATIYGEAYDSAEELLARDTVTIWVVENL